MDSSDEEKDEEDIWWRPRYSRWSVGKEDDDAAAFKAALGRVGHHTRDSMESQDGTVEGLIYALSEDDEPRGNGPLANDAQGWKTLSHITFRCCPLLSNQFSLHHLRSSVPTNANGVHR
jgi:hypothetical protein